MFSRQFRKTVLSPIAWRPLSYSLQSARSQSSASDFPVYPAYRVYAENVAFIIKAIPPEVKVVGRSQANEISEKGRLLLEFVGRQGPGGKFEWTRPLRFALSPEEAGLVLARLKGGLPIELNRQTRSDDDQYGVMGLQKVLRVMPASDGSVQMICDFEVDGIGGQTPPSSKEGQGPFELSLMVGESQVLQSILEYSIPRLIGWAPMLDQAIQQSFQAAKPPSPPYTSSRGSGGHWSKGVPF